MPGKKIASWEQKRKKLGYIFIAPFIVGMVLFILVPVITSLSYSFSNMQITATGYELKFVGIENYRKLLMVDPSYRKLLLSSLGDMLVNVPLVVIFSFFIASILNTKFVGRGLVRGIFFLPVILSAGIYVQLAQADQMSQMMAQNMGGTGDTSMANAFVNMLTALNLNEGIISFLVGAVSRISTIVSMSAIPIVIFLAGFQSISPSIFEASYIEGATKWEVFWKVSVPMVSSLILVSVIYTIVDSFTNSSNAMISRSHNITFKSFDFGTGSAMMWIYMLMVFLIIFIVYKLINKHIFYYD